MKTYIHKILIVVAIFSVGLVSAQVPVPAEPQSQPMMIKGATAHLGNGQVIENSVIAFDKGKITIVGTSGNEAGHQVIDATGQHIYPGFILPNTQTGLQEVSSIGDMSDNSEQGSINPNVRAQIAYNTDSEFPPVFKANGILMVETTPTGGVISGSSSVMQLDAWNWEDATYKVDAAIHMNWPGRTRFNFDFATFTRTRGPNPSYASNVESVKKTFLDAISFGKLSVKDKNLKLESMLGLFDGSKLLMIHTNSAKSIVESVKFAQEMGVKRIGVVSGTDALIAADFLVDNKIPVVVPSIHSQPSRVDDDYDQAYKLAAKLTEKGVRVSLSHSGMLGLARNLPFYAGTSVAHGMEKEEALKMITSNTAKLLGIDANVGTLEVGKDATMFVSKGDALDYKGNVLSSAYIMGRSITLEGRQEILFKKYSEKYGH